MGKQAKGSDRPRDYDVVDWDRLKKDIISKLDVAREFEALGIVFTKDQADNRGWRECHAIGRKQQSPSAGVHIATARYSDFGSTEKSVNIFDFAFKYGNFERIIDVFRYYAEKVKIEIGRPQTSHRQNMGTLIKDGHFDYKNPDGLIRYRVFRYIKPKGGKHFEQRPPDGQGGWRFGPEPMKGVDPLPYRLPELLASDPETETVFIAEGERKADRLASLGLVATSSHGGCGRFHLTWTKFDSSWFRGRHYVLLPDNSDDGRAFMAKVAGWLTENGAGSTKLLNLPDLTRDGDVIDWLDQGGTVEELQRLAHEAEEWEPGKEPESAESEEPTILAFRSATVADVRRVLNETRWLWDGWIPTSRTVGIAGLEGTGKTRFAMDLFRRTYLGLTWPDGSPMTVPAGIPSIWVCSDAHQDELADMMPAFGLPDEAVHFATTPDEPYGGTDIDDSETLEHIEETIQELHSHFLIIDTLTSATARDLCDQRTMKPLKMVLAHLTQTYHVTILLLLHMNQQGQALGRRIKGITRTLMHLECPDEDKPERLRLWVEKSFSRKPAPLGLTMGDGGNEYDGEPPARVDRGGRQGGKVGRPDEAYQKAREFFVATLTARQAVAVVDLLAEWVEGGGAESTFWRIRKQMLDSGEATVDDGKPKMMRLTGFVPEAGPAF